MFWIYWDTFWLLFFSAVWFMTIVSHPDAEIADRQRRCHVNFHIDPKTIEQPNEQMEHAKSCDVRSLPRTALRSLSGVRALDTSRFVRASRWRINWWHYRWSHPRLTYFGFSESVCSVF